MSRRKIANDIELFDAIAKLTNAWLIMKAMDADDDSEFSHDYSMDQHEKVQACVAELVEAASVNDLIGNLLAERKAKKKAEAEAMEHFAESADDAEAADKPSRSRT